MRHSRRTKLLQVFTFIAASVGLALGTTALAAPPATDATPSGELAQAEQDPQTEQPEAMPEDEPATEEEEQAVDFPGSIEDFEQFVEDHRQEGIDDANQYVYDGADNMGDAFGEVLPQEDKWFEEEPQEFQTLEDDLDQFRDDIDQLSDTDREDFARVTSEVLNNGAQWLTDVEEHVPGDMTSYVEEVGSAAENIDPNTEIDQQTDAVQTYYDSAVTTVKQMYTALEQEDPLAKSSKTSSALFAGKPVPVQDDQEDDGGLFGGGEDDLPGGVEDFNEFIEENREEGIAHVADYTREGSQHFHDALAEFIGEDEELLQTQLDEFSNSVDQLEDTPREEYPQTLVDTLNEGGQIMMVIQQADYPQLESRVSETLNTIEQINTDVAIEDQVGVIENAFAHTAGTLESMARAEEPAAKVDDKVVLAQDTGETPQTEPERQPGMEEEQPGMEEQPEMGETQLSEEIQNYADAVEQLDADQLSGEQGQQMVADAMGNLHEAIGTFVEQQPADEQQQQEDPSAHIERAEYGGEESGGEMGEHSEERQSGDLAGKHEELGSMIDDLEMSVGEDDFSQQLADTARTSTETLEMIQQEQFPDLSSEIQEVRQAGEAIDADTELGEQAQNVIDYFEANRQALEAMDQQQQQPVTLW